MRSKPISDLWLSIPAVVGKRLARGFRKVSPKTTPMAVWTREELLERAQPLFSQGADMIICGHIHMPQHHHVELGGRRRDLYVLGDWDGGTRDYVAHDARGFTFTRWDP